MSLFCCKDSRGCLGLAVIASVVVGVITSLLTVTAAITLTPAFLWVVLGVVVVYLAVLLLAVSLSERNITCGSFYSVITALLIGILGSALFAILLLAISFPATSIFGAIAAGALLLLFSLVLTSTACLVKCIIRG